MTELANDAALKLLSKTETVLEKYMGPGVFAADEPKPIPRIPTGITVIDQILGGGLPKGMVTEIYGPESNGKTTFCAQVCAHNQRLDPNWRCLYLDFEQTVDLVYFQKGLGLDVTKPRLILSQPNTLEEGALIARALIMQGLVHQVIWDTPGASQPASIVNAGASEKDLREGLKAIDSGKSSTGRIGQHAQSFTMAMAGLIPHIAAHQVVFLIPNQTRTTIATYGSGETTPGGKALKFQCAIRIRLSKTETTKESVQDEFFGTKQATATENVIQFHTVKNKTAPPFRKAEVRLAYGRGFLDLETTLDLAVKRKVVDKAGGGNFKIPTATGGVINIRGTEHVLTHWREHPDDFIALQKALKGAEPDPSEFEMAPPQESDDTEGTPDAYMGPPKPSFEEQLAEVESLEGAGKVSF